MAFSIKQIKAILSSHNMPVDDLDAAAEDICARHSADLDSIKEERDTFKKDAETLADVQKELDALKANTGDDFKAKWEKEKQDFAAYKKDVEARETKRTKEALFRKVAQDAGLDEKGVERAVKYAAWDSIELDENGEIKDPKAHIKALREEWPEHIRTTEANVTHAQTPPAGMNTDTGNGNRAAQLYAQHRAALYGETTNTNAQKGESK